MYGIHEKTYASLINYFNHKQEIETVILFGSRATHTATIHSDIDLCIQVNRGSKGAITEDIDEIIGIYSCDIVFTDQLNEELKKQIARDGVIIFRKTLLLNPLLLF
ncbi:hypothetical protein CEW92_06855 [Bacillaceae bacterium SAS-127]|nr:hypothetical protein CEW92_06855 [Bacillaceae bacterium SAS-127]